MSDAAITTIITAKTGDVFPRLAAGLKVYVRRNTPLGFRQLMSAQISQLSRQFAALTCLRLITGKPAACPCAP